MSLSSPVTPTRHPEQALLRIGAVSSVLGLLLSIVAVAFHGGGPHPDDLQATLPEYAANGAWEVVHLAQFVADVLLLIGYFALYRSLVIPVTGASVALARLAIVV